MQRSITAEDLFQIALVGDTALHPEGNKAVISVTRLLPEENEYQTNLWLILTSSGDATPFTTGSKKDTSPAWSPDGKWLAFLSNREGNEAQVYVLRENGGEALQVTFVKGGVQSFRWRPDSKGLAVSASVPEWQKDEVKRDRKDHEKSPRERFTEDVKVIHRTFYRLDGVGYFGQQRSHVLLVDLDPILSMWRHGQEGGSLSLRDRLKALPVLRATEGPFDVQSYDWSPDGCYLAVVANLDPDADENFRQYLYELDVNAVRADAKPTSGERLRRLATTPCWVEGPKYSPHGRSITYYGHRLEHAYYTQQSVWRYDRESGTDVCLTANLDVQFGNEGLTDTRAGGSAGLTWSEHGRYIYTLVSIQGTVHLGRIHATNGGLEMITEGQATIFTYSLDRRASVAAMVRGTPLEPANVFVVELPATQDETPNQRRLTRWNREWAESVSLVEPQRFTFESDGLKLDAWIMLPSGEVPSGGFPAVIQVHGGPMAMYADNFFLEFQLLAARGIAVVYCNPRGSMGYGQAFCASIRGDWGTLDFQDVENCMDAALAQYPLNPQRLSIAGGSYGGFMAAWAIGHTKRYQSAVVMRSVTNEYSMFGTCDVGYADLLDFSCAPWEQPERYFRVSPIASAGEIDSEVLIIHSENDLRCPIEQAEQLYTALCVRKVPVEFVRFPDESHGLSRTGKPWHRVYRLEKIESFLCRTLGIEHVRSD